MIPADDRHEARTAADDDPWPPADPLAPLSLADLEPGDGWRQTGDDGDWQTPLAILQGDYERRRSNGHPRADSDA